VVDINYLKNINRKKEDEEENRNSKYNRFKLKEKIFSIVFFFQNI
jgi:hypothetical protein